MSFNNELSSFRIIETIQESKRYLVHKAETLIDHKLVLIKTAVPTAAHDTALLDSLRSEAEAGMKLRHPAIRAGLKVFEDAGQVFMIAEFAEGISLGRYLLSHPRGVPFDLGLSWPKVLPKPWLWPDAGRQSSESESIQYHHQPCQSVTSHRLW
ncbi:MAG: hypothetical protein LRZ88_04025 [Candidatus Cloacimonetes bacterium]|nr:hypothetical protein [Candidatus Cloacimonadota bacterium]